MTMSNKVSTIRFLVLALCLAAMPFATPNVLLAMHLNACRDDGPHCADHHETDTPPDQHDQRQCHTCHLLKALNDRGLPGTAAPAYIIAEPITVEIPPVCGGVQTRLPQTLAPRAPPAA